jgi:hypothetical protein
MKLSEQLAGKNFGPRFSQAISAADDQIEYLRAKGLNEDADLFARQISDKINRKDESIASNLSALGQVYSVNLKATKPAGEKEKVEELPADLAASIEDLAKKSQARNIALNPESLRDYADAALTGDNDTLARLYKEFDSEYKGALDIQQKEKKTLQRLEDGTQVLRGEQSGTMYSPAGLPLSVGDINTRVVNERLAGPIPELMQAQISGDVGVPYQPQVYEQPVQQAEPQLAASQEGKIKAQRASLDKSKAVLVELDRFINATEKMSTLPFASPARKLMAAAGFEEQAEVENMLITIRANLQFEQIKELKALSPTGSTGLGAVTKPEFDALGATLGQLSQVGDPKVQKQRALALKKKFLDAVHGSKEEREEALKQGKITKEANEMVESLYPGYDQSKVVIDPRVEELRSKFKLPPR